MSDTRVELTDWLSELQKTQPLARKLLSQSPDIQQKEGYYHTLREICQQPLSWQATAELRFDPHTACSLIVRICGPIPEWVHQRPMAIW